MIVEIVIFALIAIFVGLRLFAILGQRTGHEQQQPIAKANPNPLAKETEAQPQIITVKPVEKTPEPIAEAAVVALRKIVAIENNFDLGQFMHGALLAYKEILEAFWKGDEETLKNMVSPSVLEIFNQAIAARTAEGLVLDNRLISIDNAEIVEAKVENNVARITIRFDADIAGVTRNRDGQIVAGSLSDAIPTHDLWTFARQLKSGVVDWTLIETDQAQPPQ